jgi:hypothetical protein
MNGGAVAATAELAKRAPEDPMNSSTRAPAVLVVTLSIDELRTLVRDVVSEALTQQAPTTSGPPLVDRHELARLLGVSAATITP